MAFEDQPDDQNAADILGQKHKKSKLAPIHAAFINEAKAEDIDDTVQDSDFDDDSDGD